MPDDETTDKPEPKGSGAATFTQADVDRIVAERVGRERAKYADYDDVKSKAGSAEAAEKRAQDAERKLMVSEIAQAKGLTPAQAKRLTGSTRDELESDADDLLSAFGGGQSANEGDSKEKDEAADNRPPKEDLRPGASREEDNGDDVGELADEILSRDF